MNDEAILATALTYGVDGSRLLVLLREICPAYEEEQTLRAGWNEKNRLVKKFDPVFQSIQRADELAKRLPPRAIEVLEAHARLAGNSDASFRARLQSLRDDLLDFSEVYCREAGNPGVARDASEIELDPLVNLIADLKSLWPSDTYGHEIMPHETFDKIVAVSDFVKFVHAVLEAALSAPPSLPTISTAIRRLKKSTDLNPRKSPS